MRQLRRYKKLSRRSLTRSHKKTSMGRPRSSWNCITSALQPEESIRRALEFHVCTINTSAHTKKSLETYLMIIVSRTPVGGCPIDWSAECTDCISAEELDPPPHWVSWIWHKTIWCWCSSNVGNLNNAEHPFIVIAPRPTLPGMVEPDRVLSMGQRELKCIFMLNRTAWNRTVLTFKLRTYVNLNCFCMLN